MTTNFKVLLLNRVGIQRDPAPTCQIFLKVSMKGNTHYPVRSLRLGEERGEGNQIRVNHRGGLGFPFLPNSTVHSQAQGTSDDAN